MGSQYPPATMPKKYVDQKAYAQSSHETRIPTDSVCLLMRLPWDALYQLYKGLPEMIRRALNDGSIKPENEDLFSVLFEKVFT
jgi:hypothetical protein